MEAAFALKQSEDETVNVSQQTTRFLPIVPSEVLTSLRRGGLYELGESYMR